MTAKGAHEETDFIILALVLAALPVTLDGSTRTHLRAHDMVLLLTYAGINFGYGPVKGFNDFRGPGSHKLVTALRHIAQLQAEDPTYLPDLVSGAAVMLKPEISARIRDVVPLLENHRDSFLSALRHGYATEILRIPVEDAYRTFGWPPASGHEEIAATTLISKLLAIRDAA